MASIAEMELENELEQELELESEHEQESEHEAFFNHLAAMADRRGYSQSLRRIALTAARSALKHERRRWPVIEGESEMEAGPGVVMELELEASPAQQEHFAAMMEHAGHAAAEAANEQEAAEHFLPLIGLAAKVIAPKLIGLASKKIGGKLIGRVGAQLIRRTASRALRRVVPRLTRGIGDMTRTLFRNRTTRPLLHAMPRIARGTMLSLLRRAARGRNITPRLALRTLAGQAYRTLSRPRLLSQAYRRSLAMDRRFHRYSRRVLGRPAGPMVRASGSAAAAVAQAAPAAAQVVPGMHAYVPAIAPALSGIPVMPAFAQSVAVPGAATSATSCPTCGR